MEDTMADLFTNIWFLVFLVAYLFFLARSLWAARHDLWNDWKRMPWATLFFAFTVMPLAMMLTDLLEITDWLFWREPKNKQTQ